jgi:diacylglycerol O-acyltransferase/trehalose O-mycolyltransferase
MNETFVHQLAAQSIPVTVDAYGPGTHADPYMQRDLARSLPFLLKALGE